MKTHLIITITVCLLFVFCICNTYASEDPVAWWKFDKSQSKTTIDGVSGIEDEVLGFHKYVPGVKGDAVRFDGYSTGVRRIAKDAPKLGDSFSFEAWVAFQAYPWGKCAIVDQCELDDVPFARRTYEIPFPNEPDPSAGYYFAVDASGKVHLQVSIGGEWKKCQSEERIPLLEWAHIAGTYHKDEGLAVYINGKNAGTTQIEGEVNFNPNLDVLIGLIKLYIRIICSK